MTRIVLTLAALICGLPALAQSLPDELAHADVVLLGEIHDNPAHHAHQAAFVAELAPKVLVFEMLTPEQASRITADNRQDPATLAKVLDWDSSGWPGFDMYFPIIAAAPQAEILGAAVPREAARSAMKDGIAPWFGADAAAYGLTSPLPEEQQTAREAMQQEAHCNALPDTMLPMMVDLQRLRDAVLARAALRGFDDRGAPVVVITGNGHARKDWGVPGYLARLRPDISVASLGQTEDDDSLDPNFDLVLSSPAAQRDDPCAAFR